MDAQLLQQCGHRTVRRFGRAAAAVLGTNRIAYLYRSTVRVRDLERGTLRTIPWPIHARPTIALADRRVLISEPKPGGGYAIYEDR